MKSAAPHFLLVKMSTAVSQQISLFRFQVENRRFVFDLSKFSFRFSKMHLWAWFLCRLDEGTLRILESVLAWNDFKSLYGVVCTLKQFMRHESLCIIQEIAGKSAEHKLLIVDFLVHIFALIGDTEVYTALNLSSLIDTYYFFNLFIGNN